MRSIVLIGVILLAGTLQAQQVGDPGVTFDESKFDPDYPQMAEWTTAGVRGGIPFVDSLIIKQTLSNGADSADINAAIQAVLADGGGAVLLQNGTYDINDEVSMQSGVSLVGESRAGVHCVINPAMTANSGAFEFKSGVSYSGIYRLTIEGGWGTPIYDWNIGSSANNELPGNENISVFFKDVLDCWIDDCTILNSADFPVRIAAYHVTVRNCHIDGVFNKHGGAHGYFFVLDGNNLITGCYITHLRHISLQGDGVRYNVVYDNDFAQEVSFHSGDDGDNLIENNRIYIPADMPNGSPNYFSIMGPWSIQHQISTRPNYIYKNDVIEYNHGGATPWSDPNVVYYGPHYVKPADPYTNFTPYSGGPPLGGTLYPIILGDPVPAEGVTVSPASSTVTVYDSIMLTATVAPSNASNPSVIWTTSDASIAGVDAAGRVTGVSAGSATITATTLDGGFSDTSYITVNPSSEVRYRLSAVEDAYLQGTTPYNTTVLRVESGNRVSYLMFDLSGITGTILSAKLEWSVAADPGNGTITIDVGDSTTWTETTLSTANAPGSSGVLGSLNGTFSAGSTYIWDLNASLIAAGGPISLIATHLSGNDISFVSDENANAALRPVLEIITTPPIDPALLQWLTDHGLSDPHGDADLDGFDNKSEFISDTQPTNGNSYFKIGTEGLSSNGFAVVFNTATNRRYAVKQKASLTNLWSDLTNGINGSGAPVTIYDPMDHTQQFYRVTVELGSE